MQLGNLTDYPYPSFRRVTIGKRGAVATSQPLATLAGMEMLLAGGNAVGGYCDRDRKSMVG
jgi:gamma-glutamyltranspeptidase/glutathione hydrolase